ncbi:MFS transporter [Pararhodobacter zhoushanensis]|uniref:MFS transporter n=1 Tax=Pararhodobacter zhoushanensis TaxID=2479545 RepID=UPI000F8DB05A|nr:MFS transporter [Pararhodobacter zhoushanensis]
MAIKFTSTTVALLMAACLTILSNATISPALPQIAIAFDTNPNAQLLTRLLVTAPALLVAMLSPLAGILVDRIARKPVLLIGTAIFGVAGTAGLYLPSLEAIFVSRLFLGAGVAFAMTAQSALIGDLFAGPDRGTFLGYQIAATNFGGFLAITLAGLLAAISFRYPFAIYGMALIMLPYFWQAFDNARPTRAQDGTVAVNGSGAWGVPLLGLCLVAFLSISAFYVMPTQFPFYLQEVVGVPPSTVGFLLGLLTLAGGIAALASGGWRKRAGHLWSLVAGQAILAFGFVIIAANQALPFQFIGAAFIGAGFAAVIPSIMAWMFDVVPSSRRGIASGIMTTALFLGQFASPFFSQPIIEGGNFRILFWSVAALFGMTAIFLVAKSLLSGSTK